MGTVKKLNDILIYSKLDWIGIDLKAYARSYFEYKDKIIRLSIDLILQNRVQKKINQVTCFRNKDNLLQLTVIKSYVTQNISNLDFLGSDETGRFFSDLLFLVHFYWMTTDNSGKKQLSWPNE